MKIADQSRQELFTDRKLGMFIHWGLYTIMERGEWVLHNEKLPLVEYEALSRQFLGERFDADAIVRLAVESGMKYIVMTAKHHDGFCLFNSALTNYTTVKTAAKRDFIGELADACHKYGIGFHPYYSLWDWHHPDFVPDDPERWRKYLEYFHGQVRELCVNYGTLSGMWFDCGGGPRLEQYELQKAGEMIHELQTEAAVMCLDYWVAERGCMPAPDGRPKIMGHAAETLSPGVFEICETVNDHYGFFQTDKNFKSPTYLLHYFLEVVGHGGNFLLNLGPQSDGSLDDESVACLGRLRQFTKRYADAIYGARAELHPSVNPIGYTLKRDDHAYFLITDFTALLDSLSESTNPLESMEGTVNILFNGVRTPVESVCCFGGAALLFTQRGLRLSVAVPRRLLKWPCTIIDVKTSGVAEIDGNIRPGSDGGFELTTEWAGIYTANPGFPRYFPGTDKDHPGRIGFWNQLGTHVEWLLNVPQSGIFEVVIEQACPGGDAGSVYELSIEKPSFMSKTLIVNHETGETVVQAGEAGRKVVLSSFTQPTASWYDYIEVPIGRINLPAGLVKVELRPVNLKRGAFMDVRNVRMKTLRL